MSQTAATQVVGNVGMYYAAYRLSQLGWNVMPTARNARGIDLLIYDASAKHFLGIQVKALSRRSAVPLGNSPEKVMGDWWIIVSQAATEPKCYILASSDVRDLANQNGKDDRISYWLEMKNYETEAFREAWAKIGRGDSPTNL